MKVLMTLLLAILPFSTSLAVDKSGNYAVWGVGKKSCFQFNKVMSNEDKQDDAIYISYIKGFLTAINIVEPETYNISGRKSFGYILEWIEDSCELKQIHSIEQTLLEFVEEHYDSRSRHARKSGVGR